MIKNKAESSYGAKGIRSSKWLLLLCAASAAVVDIVIIAMLFAGGEGGEYLACPFLLLIFDLFYFAVSLFFTNFRFRYSMLVWLSYVVLYTVGLFIGLAINLGDGGTVLSSAAFALWACVHVFNILCAVVCALFASRVIKKAWFALAVAAVFIIGSVAYSGFMFALGYFGQGTGSRTLVYDYYKDKQEYAVTGVLAGRSDKITVPETFNGKPVTAVSMSLFTESGVKEFNLPDNVSFIDGLPRNIDMTGKRINVDKKAVNDYREKFLQYAGGLSSESAVKLANATLPVNLAENEGYVAFNYEAAAVNALQRNVIPVYVGDLKNFDIGTYTAGYDYVQHPDNGSADNYYWAYYNSRYILTDLGVSGNVTESTVADVKFEKVYRINVDNGNDTMYPMREKEPELCFDDVYGRTDYKYLTKPMASDFLDGFKSRKGFTCNWKSGEKTFTDLTEVLADNITISAQWELKKPTLALSTSAANNTYTYGEDVTVLSGAQIEADGVTLNYNWVCSNGSQIWHTENVSLTHPKPSEYAGTYSLYVTVDGGDVTSCAAGVSANASINLKINPKPVTLDWQLPENTVYDGTLKTVEVTYDESQNVEDNPLEYSFPSLKSFKDAGTYNFSIVTNVITDMNYKVLNPKNSLTIQPCPVEVDWSNYENLEYNGLSQCPLATAYGIPADGMLALSVSSGNKNAGSYTATATTPNTNYTLTGATRPYTIAKKPLTITVRDAEILYGKFDPQQVLPVQEQCSGFVEGDDVSSLSGFATLLYDGKDAGTYEGGVKMWGLTSNNYEISYVYGTLKIHRREVQYDWVGADNLVYDGTAKNVTAVVTKKGYDDDDIRLIVTGGNETAAGEYEAWVSIDPDCEDKGNYFIYGLGRKIYTIQKRTVTAEWYVTQDGNVLKTEDAYVYNGKPYGVGFKPLDTVVYDRQFFHMEGETYQTDAGTYTYTLVADESIADNYIIENGEFEFTIVKAQSEITVTFVGSDGYGKTVTGDKIWINSDSYLLRKSNIPGVEVEVYAGNPLNRVDAYKIQFMQVGEYNLMFKIPETNNYSGKTVYLTVVAQ